MPEAKAHGFQPQPPGLPGGWLGRAEPASARRSPPPSSSCGPPFRRSCASTPGGIQERFLLGAPGRYGDADRTPHLAAAAAAARARLAVVLRYRRWRAPEEIERRGEPYGLVLKAGRWYLVADGPSGIGSYRIDQILEIRPLQDECAIQDGFDPARPRNSCLADFRARLHTGEALLRLTPEGARRLGVTPTGEGWTEARVLIESIDHAYGEFLRLGADVEVMAPAELRDRIADTGRTMATRYEG